MNQTLEVIIDSLKNRPNEWKHCNHGAHTLEHKSKLSIWMSNIPIIDTNVYCPYPLPLNLFEKYRLYQAAKYVTDCAILDMLKD